MAVAGPLRAGPSGPAAQAGDEHERVLQTSRGSKRSAPPTVFVGGARSAGRSACPVTGTCRPGGAVVPVVRRSDGAAVQGEVFTWWS